MFQWLLHETMALTEKWLYFLYLRVQNYTSVSVYGGIHTQSCFQNICALSQVFRGGSSQHLSSKINMTLLAINKRGSRSQKLRPSEAQTQLCSLSLPSELLSCSYSFLNPIQRIKPVSCYESSCI